MLKQGILTSSSIRTKLMMLLLLIFLPAFGIIILSSLDRCGHEIQVAENNALLLAQSLAAQQEQIATGTQQMLSTLAQLPEVQGLRSKACDELFRRLSIQYPFYSFIGMTTPDGNILASSRPFIPGSINLSGRKHIRDTLRTLDFSAGEYIVAQVSKLQSIHYAYPVFDANRTLSAIIIAGFKLDEYARFITKAKLPEGSTVVITDHAGVHLFRLPEADAAGPGKPIPRDSFERISGDLDQGIFERISDDGIDRIYAFKQLRLRENLPPYLYMIVGIPKDEIFHSANLEMVRNLLILLLAAFLTMWLAWIFGNFVLVRPLSRLVTATQRFGNGEMGVRTNLPRTTDELGQLATSFDDMASMLEIRNTERRNAEEKYRNIFVNALEGIYQSTPDGKYIEANPAFARILGYDSPQELMNAVNDIGHQIYLDQETRRECVRRVMERGAAVFEIRIRRKDGSVGWVSNKVRVVRDLCGTISHFEGIAQDISERKRMEEALRESEENYRLIAENATEIISKYTPEGICLYASPSCRISLGYESEEVMGDSVFEYIHPDDLEEVRKSFSTVLSKPVVSVVSCRVRRKDGNYAWFETTSKTIRDSDTGAVKDVLAISRDISKRKRMEDELIKAKKLEATGIFAGGIAHDFNNLLSIIIGNIDLAKDQMQQGTSAFNFLSEAEKTALRASDLTKRFITFSTGGAPQKKPASIERLILEAASLAVRNSNVECRYSFPEDVWQVEVDQDQMSQVFYDVVLNAKEAMPDGGGIDVVAENIQVGSEREGLALKEGFYVRLAVRDYGMGISGDNLRKIFDPYYSTKDRGTQKGMGMGLTVAYSIVRKHGGHITVKSEIGSGTTACIYLPASNV